MISAQEVRKTYAGASAPALDGLDLEVARGTVCGLLGPNGAGKTTAIRILSTLMRLDSGSARVAGFDVATQGAQVRRQIGVVGQYAAVDEILSGTQNLVMFGRLCGLSLKASRRRAGELLEQFDLADTGSKPVAKYSGGMRRRLDLAASLIVAPQVLFVDEPTTGLDPQARQEVWAAIRQLVRNGTTVLLTTQYMEEADLLADHIAMLWHGRVVQSGTPAFLKASVGTDWIDVTFADARLAERAAKAVNAQANGQLVSIPAQDGTRALVSVAGSLAAQGIEPEGISLRRPTLDEVFMEVNARQEVRA
jgi:ABC-2 type transport system ATP-binding protein